MYERWQEAAQRRGIPVSTLVEQALAPVLGPPDLTGRSTR